MRMWQRLETQAWRKLKAKIQQNLETELYVWPQARARPPQWGPLQLLIAPAYSSITLSWKQNVLISSFCTQVLVSSNTFYSFVLFDLLLVSLEQYVSLSGYWKQYVSGISECWEQRVFGVFRYWEQYVSGVSRSGIVLLWYENRLKQDYEVWLKRNEEMDATFLLYRWISIHPIFS